MPTELPVAWAPKTHEKRSDSATHVYGRGTAIAYEAGSKCEKPGARAIRSHPRLNVGPRTHFTSLPISADTISTSFSDSFPFAKLWLAFTTRSL